MNIELTEEQYNQLYSVDEDWADSSDSFKDDDKDEKGGSSEDEPPAEKAGGGKDIEGEGKPEKEIAPEEIKDKFTQEFDDNLKAKRNKLAEVKRTIAEKKKEFQERAKKAQKAMFPKPGLKQDEIETPIDLRKENIERILNPYYAEQQQLEKEIDDLITNRDKIIAKNRADQEKIDKAQGDLFAAPPPPPAPKPSVKKGSAFQRLADALGLKGTSLVESLGETARNGKINNVSVVIQQGDNENEVIIESIKTPKLFRKKGMATKAMKKITDAADAEGMTITLRAVPEDAKQISEENLKAFYEKFGFEFKPGSNKGIRVPLTPTQKKNMENFAAVSAKIKELQQGAVNALESEVVATPEDLPTILKEEDINRDNLENIVALYDPKTGKVYFVSSNITPDEVVSVWIHEQGIHRGLRVLFKNEEDLNKILKAVFKSVGIDEIAASIPAPYTAAFKSGTLSEVEIAEEYLAFLASKIIKEQDLAPKQKSIWQKFVDAIKKLLKKVYPDARLLDTDIADIVKASTRAIYEERIRDDEGDRMEAEAGKVKAALSADTQTNLTDLETAGFITDKQRKGIVFNINKNLATMRKAGNTPTAKDEAMIFMEALITEGKYISNRAYKAFHKVIAELLKELSTGEKKFITPGQHGAILRMLANATTAKARQKVIDYINDTVIFGRGAKFKYQLNRAKDLLEKVKEENRGEKSKFGTAREVANRVLNIDLNELSYDDLITLNTLLAKVVVSRKVPNVAALLMIDETFGFIQKTKKIRPEKVKDAADVITYLESMDAAEIVDVPSYISFRRKLIYIRSRAAEIVSQLDDSDESQEIKDEIERLIGNVTDIGDSMTGEFQDKLDEFRRDYAAFLYSALISKETSDGIDLMETSEEKTAARLLQNLSIEDILTLDISMMANLGEAVKNLRVGQLTPGMAEISSEVSINHMAELTHKSAFKIITEDKTNAWKKIQESGGRGWAQRTFLFFRPGNTLQKLTKNLKSKQWFRWDTWLGNYNSTKQLGKAAMEVGNAINKANVAKRMFEDLAGKAYNEFQKGKTGEEQVKLLKFMYLWMAERRWQESKHSKDMTIPSFFNMVFIDNRAKEEENAADPKEFNDDANLFMEFMELMKSKGATTEINGKDVINVAMAEAVLREDTGMAAFLDFAMSTFENYKGMNKVSALYAGKSLEFGDFYVPYMRKYKGDDLESDQNIKSWLTRATVNAQLTPGSVHDWTGSVMYTELNLLKVLTNYTEMIRRGYFVFPALRENVGAVRKAARDVSADNIAKKGSGGGAILLSKAVIEAIRSRVATYYNWNSNIGISGFMKGLEAGVKKTMLVKPEKMVSEFAANAGRMIGAMAKVPAEAWARLNVYNDFWSGFIAQYIGENLWSAYGTEVDRKILGTRVSVGKFRRAIRKGEQAADWMIKTPDKSMGRPIFVEAFLGKFKELAGEDFSEERMQAEPAYAVRFKDAIDEAGSFADSRVEQLLNSKNPMSDPEFISFLGGMLKSEKTNVIARMFNTLQSFGRNDANQIVDSFKKARFGGEKEKLQAKRDMLAIITSNAFYGIFRSMIGVAAYVYVQKPIFEFVTSLFFPTQGGDDDEAIAAAKKKADRDYYDEKIGQYKSGKFYFNYFTERIALDLMLGGSANIFEYTAKVFLFVMERADGLSDGAKEYINQAFNLRYIEKIPPSYSTFEQFFKAVAPPLVEQAGVDFLSASQSLIELDYGDIAGDVVNALFDAEAAGKIDEKDVYDMANLMLIVSKYAGFNPAVPFMERHMKAELYKLRKAESKEKKGKKGTKEKETAEEGYTPLVTPY